MYIVIEIQANADGTVGTLVQTKYTLAEAESAFHGVLAAAAVSDVPKHSCVLLSDEGFPLRNERYLHESGNVSPQPGEGE